MRIDRTLGAGLLLIVVLLSGCNYDVLPEQRPEDLQIEFVRNGGIFPEEERISITGNMASYTYSNRDVENTLPVELSAANLDSIYNRMKLNYFRRLESHDGFGDETIKDIGSVLIASWSDQSDTIDNTGTRYLNPGGDELAYGAIVEMIRKVVLEKIPREEVVVQVTCSGDSIRQTSLDLEFGPKTVPMPLGSLGEGSDTSFSFQVLPGQHRLSFRITPPSGPRTRFTKNLKRQDTLRFSFDGRVISKSD